MITTGIIKEINLSSGEHKNNRYTVELALFQIPGDMNNATYTYEANCMVPSGFSSLYNVNDKVYVGFLNSDKSSPIILGKIYQGISDVAQGYGCIQDLKVANSTNLSKNTKIGDYTYLDLDKTIKGLGLIQENYVRRSEFDELKNKFDLLLEKLEIDLDNI